jgi:RNA-dependent RNA polymerase
MDDFIQQEDGVIVHRGEELDLFRQDIDSESLSDDGNLDFRESHDFVTGDSGDLVLATEFQFESPVPEHLCSGTGVEDVVPRTILDGFDDPREKRTYESGGLRPYYFNNWRRSSSPMGNNTNNRNSPSDGSTPATPTSSSTAGLSAIEREILQDVEEGIPKLNIKEPSFEKLAKMVDHPTSSDAANPLEDTVEEEAVSVGIKQLPLRNSTNLVGESASQAGDLEEGVGEEELVKVKAKESALEKLARMMGS